MTQEEFDDQFISAPDLCTRLGKAHNYLAYHIDKGTFPAPLMLRSGKNKIYKLYYKDDIRHNLLIEGVL
jgi:hypothetical protein